jgi:uncharacterized protein YcfJ
MKVKVNWILALAALAFAGQVAAQVTFYEQEGFRGRTFTTDRPIVNFDRTGFNDRASSMIIDRGRWEICDDAGFRGRCVVLRRGQYPSLNAMGMGNRVSSIRPAGPDARYSEAPPPPPAPVPAYEYYPRQGERLFSADVTSVHAVVGPPEQRCWVERQQVGGDGGPNVPGAIIGGILGGVLGHQVGGGRGQDVATAGGAVGGALLGSNVGRGNGGGYAQDVQRCSTVQGGRPEYWDVTYVFRGQQHRVQMAAPPGPTIPVNGRGEPRI